MADHYNLYHLKHLAATVAECMELQLPEEYAPGVSWACDILKKRLGGKADRVVMYHADAVGMYIWQKYTNRFAPVYEHTSLAIPFLSTVPSITPVAHASMYTGLEPKEHGIQNSFRPQLCCSTLYDELIRSGKKPVIIAQTDSSFHHIFKGRDMEYYEYDTINELQEKALDVIASDDYDLLSIHTFDYDTAAHHYGPESKDALNALSMEAQGFDRIAKALKKNSNGHRILLAYSPDHGQHLIPGDNGIHGCLDIEDMNILHFFGTII